VRRESPELLAGRTETDRLIELIREAVEKRNWKRVSVIALILWARREIHNDKEV